MILLSSIFFLFQSFEVNDHEHEKRLKKKRSTTSSVKGVVNGFFAFCDVGTV